MSSAYVKQPGEHDDSTLEYLKRAIEHAPPAQTPLFTVGLTGWKVGREQCGVCVSCSSRILARGCYLPMPQKAVWDDLGMQIECVTCGKIFGSP